jgi:predicted metalloendopeptidase
LIKHKTAYTTISPDVRSPLSLSKYNDGLQPNLTSFFDSEVKQWTWYKSMEWKKVGKPVDRDTWLLSPQTVNAYYFATNNEVLYRKKRTYSALFLSSFLTQIFIDCCSDRISPTYLL